MLQEITKPRRAEKKTGDLKNVGYMALVGIKRKPYIEFQQENHADTIIESTCKVLGIENKNALLGKGRRSTLCRGRHISAYIMRIETRMSQKEIARKLGRADHSTIVHSMSQMRAWLKHPNEEKLRMQVAAIKSLL